jgi:hypothetical protein
MSTVEVARPAPREPGIIRRIAIGFLYVLIASLAVTGAIGLLLETYSWQIGRRWQPHDINVILAHDSAAARTAKAAWEDVKYILQYGAYFIAALALFIAATQIKTVAKLMSDFLASRGAIYQLTATMSSAEETARRLSDQANRLSKLEPTIQGMAEKVEETVLRLGDMQRLQVSERTDEAVDTALAPADLPASTANDDQNWERLREIWNANGVRLDEAMERIPDKRRRARFARMDRRNYPAIINGLADEHLISETARAKSLELHGIFVSYRPRNRRIPDDVIGSLTVLDSMLADEFQRTPPSRPSPNGAAAVDRGQPATV